MSMDDEFERWAAQVGAIREAEEVALLASALDAGPADGCPLPGENHPAVAQYAQTAEQYADRGIFLVPVPVGFGSFMSEDADPTAALSMQSLTFQRSKAAQSFFHEYGAWVWPVWTDQYGRHLTGPAKWVENPNAVCLPPWGGDHQGEPL